MSTRDRAVAATDEQIEAYTIGAPRVLATTVTLHDYDPRWPARYEAQRERVARALGPVALWIEHKGSTAVPGLAAKPIIDIVLVVADPADEDSYVPALAREGFRLQIREPGWHEHRVLVKRREDGDDECVNLHVYQEGCVEPERDLIFRDWLRANADDRMLYERTKRELATRVWQYMQNYADAKTAVIEDIRTRAGEPTGSCTACHHRPPDGTARAKAAAADLRCGHRI